MKVRKLMGLMMAVVGAWIGLSACSVSLDAVPWAGLAPAGEAGGSIVYVGQDFNIYTMEGDGTNQRAVTTDAVRPGAQEGLVRTYHIPTWSPAGRLAFSERRLAGPGGAQTAVYIASPQGGAPRLAFRKEGRDPIYLYWSPAGERLTILASGSEEGLGLWLVEGDEAARQIDQGQPYYWSWAPDGSSLLAHVGGASAINPDARLSLINVGTGRRQDWTGAPLIFQAPDHSPDGQRVLAAADWPGERAGLLVLSKSGQLESRIAEANLPVAFSWSPDGRRVAYLAHGESGQPGFGSIAILELQEGGGVRQVEVDVPPVAGFFWSPTGERLAALVPELVPAGEGQNISRQAQGDQLFLRLHLVEAETGEAFALTTFRPTAAFLTVVPFFDQYARSSTPWSPDGSHLVYAAQREDGSSGVFTIEARRGAQSVLRAQGRLAFWSPQ